jgi:hypothetical protein
MPVIGKNMISWFYAYVEHIEIKTKTVNIIHFPYLDLSQNVKIRDVPYSLKSPRNSEFKLAHIYGMNKGKVFMSCVLYTNRSIDNLETQKKYISMKNSQFFDYLLYAKSK